MKKVLIIFSVFLITISLQVKAQVTLEPNYVKEHYEKKEIAIPMRDGVKLFTTIYTPKDKSQQYPVLLNRTPYTVGPYGEDKFKESLGNFPAMTTEGYIFVYQDVRGKWMSEGTFEDIRPTNLKKGKREIDESTDTYDLLEWLSKNLQNYNGKAGMYGISYPGFYSTVSLVKTHPSLKAVSPQAPVTNWYMGDDFHHNGILFTGDAFKFMSSFGIPRPKPITPDQAPQTFQYPSKDVYQFYLDAGTAKDLKDKYFADSVKFWNDVFAHPHYDQFWKDREILPHVKNVKPAVMIVGGFFDAEDTYGTFETYKTIEKQNPNNNSILVVGPWFHGGWVRGDGSSFGDIQFDQKTSVTYQEQFELPFFNYYLKGKGDFKASEANIFITGSNQWKTFEKWPPQEVEDKKLYLQPQGKLGFDQVERTDSWDEYVSDPNKPVPYQAGIMQSRTREYMIDDQRFASSRPDVMVYQTEPLAADLTIVGPIKNFLKVSTSGTDADYVVKLIDVYPSNSPSFNNKVMDGYQMLVRGEIMASKYRNGFEKAEAMQPGFVTSIDYTMPDVAHTFKKGHRIMLQVQNTWFPLAERNPQQFFEGYEATASDYRKATHRIFHDVNNSSYIQFTILK